MKAKVVATSNKRTSQDIKKEAPKLSLKKTTTKKTKERNMQTTTLL